MASGSGLRKSLAMRFDDELRFFKGWIDKPKAVGSIVPTSSITAKRMASVANPASGLPVLELGPGTGVVTRAILARGIAPQNLYAVEYSAEFAEHVRRIYPGVNVIQGDAFDLDRTLGEFANLKFDCAISAVPLLNFPTSKRVDYINGVLDRLPVGRPVIQITYGPLSPVPARRGEYTVEHFDFVIRNIPPAQLWIYRRVGNA
ncbi:phospholipid N-methyltransferase PmtA [Pseudaminobacter soli (ex Li et al. 2025)]|uniref:SAM-dependent methyltransferase n=1 Tax=Pseudaminobacter soli (ex Li et al. 2025) TaxID=1295366 RepID=A0A2P7SI85_9HYPH|nr:class I SAM-dependent methyltransferase [Mesorhizobium soli]PSJ62193.1 SAM-dependent methyltransferase [Mesorhizobium soli]